LELYVLVSPAGFVALAPTGAHLTRIGVRLWKRTYSTGAKLSACAGSEGRRRRS
jgi:hypothetical protein